MTAPFAALQQRFAAALRDADTPGPVASSAGRFSVHRNNVAAGILGVLEARFAVVRQLVGEGFFRAMAAEYTAQDPPRSPILMLYGQTFPAFVANFEPAADVPYLADVAQLEWLQHTAYHATDCSPIGADKLSAIPVEAIATVHFDLHPSLGLLASNFPVLSIWRMHMSDKGAKGGTLAATPEFALILRPALDVETHEIGAVFHNFTQSLAVGKPLGVAAELALAKHAGFDLQSALAGLISHGAIAGYRLATRQETP